MTEHSILAISIIFNILLGIGCINMIKKDEKKDSVIEDYSNYITTLSDIIKKCDNKLKEIDSKGSFEADDEIGFFFKEIKNIQSILNNFKIN